MTCATRVSSVALGLVTALVAGLLAALGPAAPAAAAEGYRLPASGTFQLEGRGFGHGVGMSQFGAEGMGREGYTYRQILRFYYPGTSFGNVSLDRTIRVALTAVPRRVDGDLVVVVRPKQGLVAESSSHGTVSLPAQVGGATVMSYRLVRTATGLTLRAVADGSGSTLARGLTGQVTFRSAPSEQRSRVVVVNASGNNRPYRGFVNVRRTDSGLLVVNQVRLEDYLRSVVSAEMPGGWTPAAYQAQAVAARSYSLLALRTARSQGRVYDICDTTSCQVYSGVKGETAPESTAVKATAGEYLAAGGEPAFTMYSSANGGYSVAGSRSYLVSQPDPYDGIVTGSANWGHAWTVTKSASTFETAWPQIGRLQSVTVMGRDGKGLWGGRVQSVAIIGSAGTVTVSGDSFRWALGLKSTWWTITNAGGSSGGTDPVLAAPRQATAKPADRAVRVSWRAPDTTRTVKKYVVTLRPDARTKTVDGDTRRVRFGGLVNGEEYRATVAAVYRKGTGDRARTTRVVPISEYSYFRPVVPTRLATERRTQALTDGGALRLEVAGAGAVPSSGTRVALLRASVAGGSAPGRVVAWAGKKSSRTVSGPAFAPGQPAAGLLTVPVSRRGRVSVATTVAARGLRIDVVGYFTGSGAGTTSMRPLAATRVADTRTGLRVPGGKLKAGDPVRFRVTGRAGVPSEGVRAVLVNVAVIDSSQPTSLGLGTVGTRLSQGLAVRAAEGVRRVSTAVVPVDETGRVELRTAHGRTHAFVDVLGWFGANPAGGKGRFRAAADTTVLTPSTGGRLAADASVRVPVVGVGSIPTSARAVVLQVGAGAAQGRGFLSVIPSGSGTAPTGVLGYDPTSRVRNLLVVPVGEDGSVQVQAHRERTDVRISVVGWYS